MSEDSSPVPYCTATTDEWVKAVDRAIDATPYKCLPWTLEMECPRCHHTMTTHIDEVYGVKPINLDEYPLIAVTCNCDVDHPQATDANPDGATGCGMAANFTSPWKRPHR